MGWPIVSVSWVSVKPREKVAIEGKAEQDREQFPPLWELLLSKLTIYFLVFYLLS